MGTNITADILHLDTTKRVNVDLDAGATTIVAVQTTLFAIEADNSANTVDVYVKLYDTDVDVVVGTLAPYMVLRVLAGAKLFFLLAGGDGNSFNDHAGSNVDPAILAACTTEAGQAGSTSPTNDVPVTFWTN